jgi:putative ABC transport system ATP-binding protein
MRGDVLVEAVDLERTYAGPPEVRALISATVTIREGDFVAVMGPSGSGKSTLLNILGLLDQPTGGRYRIQGTEAVSLSERERTRLRARMIGFVFQDSCLLDHRTAIENVELGLVYSAVHSHRRRERAIEVLDSVGLGRRATALAAQLSGGERQRVAIARALAPSPSLLLCDEPTGNLDSASADSVLALLQELNARGTTLIVITHNPEVATHAGRLLHIRDGVLFEGRLG